MTDLGFVSTALKALADENRLRIIGLAAEREYNVQGLAEELGLSEPTVSHHISKLRAIGVLNLRMEGNNHLYQLDKKIWRKLQEQLFNLDHLRPAPPEAPQDTSWIEALSLEDWEKDVLKQYTTNGRIRAFPVKEKKWMVMLRWMVSLFQKEVQYSEKEINAILSQYNEDYARIRRDLIEYGFMGRTKDGSAYWLR